MIQENKTWCNNGEARDEFYANLCSSNLTVYLPQILNMHAGIPVIPSGFSSLGFCLTAHAISND